MHAQSLACDAENSGRCDIICSRLEISMLELIKGVGGMSHKVSDHDGAIV